MAGIVGGENARPIPELEGLSLRLPTPPKLRCQGNGISSRPAPLELFISTAGCSPHPTPAKHTQPEQAHLLFPSFPGTLEPCPLFPIWEEPQAFSSSNAHPLHGSPPATKPLVQRIKLKTGEGSGWLSSD